MTLTKAESTVHRIQGAARALFLERNYADVTMDRIAAAAEVTKGALYHHFASKEVLYQELLHAYFDEKRQLFGRAREAEGSCRKRLELLTGSFFQLPREERRLMSLVRRDINVFRGPVRAELVRGYQEALPDQVEAILKDGMRNGELRLRDPRLLAWHYVAMVEVTLSQYTEKVLDDMGKRLQHVLDLFFDGASAKGQGVNG